MSTNKAIWLNKRQKRLKELNVTSETPLDILKDQLGKTKIDVLKENGVTTYGDLYNYVLRDEKPLVDIFPFHPDVYSVERLLKDQMRVEGKKSTILNNHPSFEERAEPEHHAEMTIPQLNTTGQSNSFSITTKGLPLSYKFEEATAGVADPLIEVAKEQFKKGAVVINP